MLRNIYKTISITIFVVGLALLPAGTSDAADYSAGDPCTPSGALHTTNDANGVDVLVCDGSNWQAAISYLSSGGLTISSLSGQPAPLFQSSGGLGKAIIDILADSGITIDAVTISTTGNKWPDYINCYDNGGTSVRPLPLWRYGDSAGDVSYGDTTQYYNFLKNGTYSTRADLDANCGATANDINTICSELGCGFVGDTDSSGSGGGSSLWFASASDIYYSSGNVGIGTNNPTSSLFIEDSTTDQNYMLTVKNNGDDGDFMEFINDTGEDVMQFRQDADGSPVLRVMTPNASHNASIRVEHNSGSSASGPRVILRHQGSGGKEWHIISTGTGNGPGAGALEFWEATGTGTALVLSSAGNVGIGDNTPDVALDVVGDINYTGVLVDVSDIRMKYDIAPLNSPLRKVTSLNGFSFKMKGDEKQAVEYGVSAQDVQQVFPELVHQVDDDGTLGVSYNGLIAPMIEAMKELKAENDDLRARIEALERSSANMPRGPTALPEIAEP